MAYQSDESGQNQVYMQSVPLGGAKYQISAAGGESAPSSLPITVVTNWQAALKK
jgi:hypothetical protein